MTAVEWLVEQFETIVFYSEEAKENTIEKAKEMEKQQIKDAFQYKFFHPYVENEPEQYYNETYKK